MLLKKLLIPILILLLIIIAIAAISIGALGIGPAQILQIILHQIGLSSDVHFTEVQEKVFWVIRLPRVVMAIVIGATLAVSGVGMQGIFRNPLAEPGIVGIGSGASLAAVLFIVTGTFFFGDIQGIAGQYALNIVTFIGALIAMILVYRISKQSGKTNITIMLLAGIAVNVLAGALTGFITIAANEQQLRTITFWTLGSLGGANWTNVMCVLPFCLATIIGIPFLGKQLNALSLGEQDATYFGINTERLKNLVMYLCAFGVGASVAVAGIIIFVGLVVPHVIRMIIGPEHKKLGIASALGGAILLTSADLLSRTVAAPVEIPIGIITSIAGGPFFLYLLLREKKKHTLI